MLGFGLGLRLGFEFANPVHTAIQCVINTLYSQLSLSSNHLVEIWKGDFQPRPLWFVLLLRTSGIVPIWYPVNGFLLARPRHINSISYPFFLVIWWANSRFHPPSYQSNPGLMKFTALEAYSSSRINQMRFAVGVCFAFILRLVTWVWFFCL